jgi:hypothetical protein
MRERAVCIRTEGRGRRTEEGNIFLFWQRIEKRGRGKNEEGREKREDGGWTIGL